MQTLLAIETSSPVLSLAVQDSKGRVYAKTVSGFSNHAENFIPCMETLLKKAKLTLPQISAFLIGQGPGSFTGLRVGFAALKGFLAVDEKKSYGVLSLDLIAEDAAFEKLPDGSVLAAALDAFREKIYLRLYKKKGAAWQPQGEARVLSKEETLAAIPEGAVVTGSALGKYGDFFKGNSLGLKLRPEKEWYPSAASLIKLFARRDAKLAEVPKAKLLPLYFRLSEAEERKQTHAAGC